MTVSSTTSRKTFAGNGATTAFDTSPLVFFVDTDLQIYLTVSATGVSTLKTETTDYTVAGGSGSTGTVTMIVAPPTGTTLVIVRLVPETQGTHLVNNDNSDAGVLETALDRLTMITQQLDSNTSRVLHQPAGDAVTIGDLPNVVARASMFLAFDASGNPIAAAGTSANLTPVSSYINTILGAATAAAARTVLGISDPGFSTGDVKLTIKTTADSGWVLMSDKTIGDASSGATERANADTAALFTLLYGLTADADCAVSGGRGASAAADYAAHKTIALPKALGRALATYGSGSGLTARALAHVVGEETHVLTLAEMAAHTHGQQASSAVGGGTSDIAKVAGNDSAATATRFATASAGSDTAHNTMQPTLFLNTMIKL